MEQFEFYVDQKVTTWMRTKFTIEAESNEIARQKAVDAVRQGDVDDIPWEECADIKEIMEPKDNGDFSTTEIFEEDGTYVWTNGKDKDHE
jgi:hypothetical protein